MSSFRPLLCSFLITIMSCPGAETLSLGRPPADLLVKINLEIEWRAKQVPSLLNAAYLINDPWKLHPRTMEVRYDYHLRESFLRRLALALQDEGYHGRMMLIEDATDADRGKPILVVTLKRWTLGQGDRFDCHFDARLVTTWETLELGTHESFEMIAKLEYVKERHVGVEKATDRALAKFSEEIAAKGFLARLPGGE